MGFYTTWNMLGVKRCLCGYLGWLMFQLVLPREGLFSEKNMRSSSGTEICTHKTTREGVTLP